MRIAFENANEWADKILELAREGNLTLELIELNVGSLTRCCDKYEISYAIKTILRVIADK